MNFCHQQDRFMIEGLREHRVHEEVVKYMEFLGSDIFKFNWLSHFLAVVILSFSFLASERGFPSGSAVKNQPAKQEMGIRSLGQEDRPEEGMATHSSIFAWRIPWTEEPGGLQLIRCKEPDTTEVTEHAGTSEGAYLRVWGRVHLNDTYKKSLSLCLTQNW